MFDAVEFWAKNGKTVYADQVHAVQCVKSETIGEAGRYWQLCPFTQATLAKLDAEIEEIRRAAADRYDDLASDPLN